MRRTLEYPQKSCVKKIKCKFGWTPSVISFLVGNECLFMSDCRLGETVQYTGAHHYQCFFFSNWNNSSKSPLANLTTLHLPELSSNSNFCLTLKLIVWARNYNLASLFQSVLSIHSQPEFKLISSRPPHTCPI